MALTDNRTQLQDSDALADISAQSTADPQANTAEIGLLIQGVRANVFQVTDAQEYVAYDQDTTGSTFNIDLSDSTVYVNIKDNLIDTFANLGALIVLCDGADGAGGDCIGYTAGGADATGLPYRRQFSAYKLDVSEPVATPGTNNVDYFEYNGTEANLDQTAILQVGYGSIHLAKAQGTIPNASFDGIYYIANDSYAATINGGTSGTPETMADVVGDDETSGMCLFANPKGTEFDFFGPTEWSETGTADWYFTATDEQWYLYGDNGGGRPLGAGHFPFRVVGNATGTNSIVLTRVAIVNIGARATWLMDDANMDILELDNVSFVSNGTISLPSSGGTSRFTTNCTFSDCDQVTNNGADMSGSQVILSNVAAGSGALLYNETTDPDGETDDMVFSQGANAHSAYEFGTSVTNDITIRGNDFTGFGSTDDVNGAVFKFLATSGSLNLNLVGCTTDGTFSVDDSAGIAVTVVIDPVSQLINVKDSDGTNVQNARVLVETAATITSGEIFEAAVTSITQSAGTATCTMTAVHGLTTGDKIVVRKAQPDGYNKVATATVTSTTVFTYPVDSGLSSPATGTPVVSYVVLHGLTDASGNISASRTWGANQVLKGVARKKNTTSPFYKDGDIAYTVDSTNGNTTNVVLQPDE